MGRWSLVLFCKAMRKAFTDADDFSAQARDPNVHRIAVLGDSFTAAQYLEQDWTEKVESYAQKAGKSVEMLNFAIAGGGLANWWSIITKHIQTEDYALDGIVFAVFEANLHRGFSVADHRNQRQHAFGRIPSWQPEQWPKTLEQAQSHMQLLRGFILSQQEFVLALNGDWLPPDPKPDWKPYASLQLLNTFEQLFARQNHPEPIIQVPSLTPPQLELIDDIASYIRAKNLPVIVASIPSRSRLLADAPTPRDVRYFANALNAILLMAIRRLQDCLSRKSALTGYQ